MCRDSPWGTKRRGCPLIIGDVQAPTGLCAGIHLGKKLHTPVMEGPRAGQVISQRQTEMERTALYRRFNSLYLFISSFIFIS